MIVRNRWDKTPPVKIKKTGPYAVKSAGYMPIAKRIDLMVRSGVKLQSTPMFYSPSDTSAPLSTRNNDLYFVEKNKKEVIERMAADASQRASSASAMARQALEKEIIENYLKDHPVPSTTPPDANTKV